MKKILILGGQGFIGINTIKYFADKEEFEIYATKHENCRYSNDKVKYITCDLTQKSSVEALFSSVNPDVVVHAAAVTTGSKDVIEKPYLHVTDNMIINSLIFEACHRYNVKHCLFFSCTVMYQPKDFAQKESDWKIEDEIYKPYFGVGSMKVFSERLCEFYSRLGNCKYTAIRHSNVYGPYDKYDLNKCHVLPAMINKVVNATDSLEIWGDGKARRDVVYIDDLVEFIDKCISKQTNPYELFNCGAGEAFSIREIITTIQSILQKNDLKFIYDETKPNIPTTVILNCKKANQLLDWSPKTSLKQGLKKTINWYIKHK